MDIPIVSGVGEGPTTLAAFDAALHKAGIAGFNLIPLSSIVPPKSKIKIVPQGKVVVDGEWGNRLYVVIAQQRTIIQGEEAWAGIGWVQEESTGKGLFVEHQANKREMVEYDIDASLNFLMKGWPDMKFGQKYKALENITCTNKPVCALVAAVFPSQKW